MATEAKKVVDLEVSGAQKSLADLRKQINDAKNALYELSEGSEEYKDKMQELGYAQDELNSFMAKTRLGCSALEGSYNALSYQMGLLKQEYKETNDEARRSELASQISSINDQLKDMDAAVGVFSRNVGNYTGAMNDVFSKLGVNVGNMGPLFNTLANSAAEAGAKGASAFSGLASGAKGLGTALKSLAANPVGAVIMAIVVAVKAAMFVFDKFKESVNRNEVASNNLKKAMAPIKAVVDVLRNAFDSLVETITKFLGWMGKVISAIGSFLGIAGQTIAVENLIADQEVSNAEMHRKFLVENAELELKASEARAKANEKDKYSAKERLALINQYAKAQQLIAANQLKEAQEELRLLELQASTGKNNAEMNNKLAEAQAKVLLVQTAYNNTLRETNGLIAQLNQSIQKDAEAEQKKIKDAAKARATEIANLKKQYTQLFNLITDELLTSDYEKQRVQAKRALDDELKQFKDQLSKKAISQKEYNKAVYEANRLYYKQVKEINNNEKEDLETFINEINKLYKSEALNKIEEERAKWNKKLEDLDKAYYEGLIKNDEDYWKAKEAINVAGNKAINKLRDEQYVKQEQEELSLLTKQYEALTALELSLLEKQYKQGQIYTKQYIEESYNARINGVNLLITAEEGYQTELSRLYEEGKITKQAYDTAMMESDTVLTNLQLENLDLIKEKQDLIRDGYINALAEMMDAMNTFASSISSIGDGISSKWANVFGNMSTMVDQVGVALKSNEKGFKKWGLVAAQACAAVSSMFGALADEQDENSEEGFEAAKKLRYAEALFSMASGIMSVWPAAMQLGPIAGPIMGGIMTAMIAGMGAALMASIAKTKYGDTGSAAASTSATGVGATVTPAVQYTSEVVGASQEDQVQDTRVYVLESDISATQSRVNVAENESRY